MNGIEASIAFKDVKSKVEEMDLSEENEKELLKWLNEKIKTAESGWY